MILILFQFESFMYFKFQRFNRGCGKTKVSELNINRCSPNLSQNVER